MTDNVMYRVLDVINVADVDVVVDNVRYNDASLVNDTRVVSYAISIR